MHLPKILYAKDFLLFMDQQLFKGQTEPQVLGRHLSDKWLKL